MDVLRKYKSCLAGATLPCAFLMLGAGKLTARNDPNTQENITHGVVTATRQFKPPDRSGIAPFLLLAQEMPNPLPGEYPETLPHRSATKSKPLRSSKSLPWPARNDPLLSNLVGKGRPAPFYVDTGRFAAAEEHRYWNRTRPQFIAISNPVEGHASFANYCWPSLVRLETTDGDVYPPLGEKREEAGAGWPHEIGQPQWAFKVNPGEAPQALYIEHPKGSPERCPNGDPSPYLTLGTDHVSIPLRGLPSQNDMGNFPQHSKGVRLGQLEIRVTSVGLASKKWSYGLPGVTPHGHHTAVISLAIRNLSRNPNCTSLVAADFHLFDNRGYEYEAAFLPSFAYRLGELLPGETTGVAISFEIWDGTIPRSLTIRRNIHDEHFCTEKQHRPVDVHGGSMVRIPITGVPVASPSAQR